MCPVQEVDPADDARPKARLGSASPHSVGVCPELPSCREQPADHKNRILRTSSYIQTTPNHHYYSQPKILFSVNSFPCFYF